MIKIKVDTLKMTNENNDIFVEIKEHKENHTNTMEHLVVIGVMVEEILDNDKDFTLNKLLKLVKDNYNKTRE